MKLRDLFTKKYRVASCNIGDNYWFEIQESCLFGWVDYTEFGCDTLGFPYNEIREFQTEQDAINHIEILKGANKQVIWKS